jgi:FixJ family two-component response regulator
MAEAFPREAFPRIAVVDDDPAVLRALSRLLRSRSFSPRTYGSGRDFLAALQTYMPDCLIVDLQMPDMNGMELQQHLVSNGISIPTILITAHGDAVLLPHDRGFVARLRKPLQEEALFDAIDKVVGSSRGR